jgi:hypothetical protein
VTGLGVEGELTAAGAVGLFVHAVEVAQDPVDGGAVDG